MATPPRRSTVRNRPVLDRRVDGSAAQEAMPAAELPESLCRRHQTTNGARRLPALPNVDDGSGGRLRLTSERPGPSVGGDGGETLGVEHRPFGV